MKARLERVSFMKPVLVPINIAVRLAYIFMVCLTAGVGSPLYTTSIEMWYLRLTALTTEGNFFTDLYNNYRVALSKTVCASFRYRQV
jgi:hypothetical protein